METHLAMFRTVKISPGPQPMIVVSGTLASAPAISFLLSQKRATYNQSTGSQVVDLGNDEGRTTLQLQPVGGRKRHSRQDPFPTSCPTKLYFSRRARSDYQLTPHQANVV